ncbi:galactose mutarotase [soil metagenome]
MLQAGSLRIEVLTYGAHLIGVWFPDRHGAVDNLVASLRDDDGGPDLDGYEDPQANPHLGSIVGRYANRIAGASFELDGAVVELLANEGVNQLHGGPVGFDRYVWSASGATDDHGAQVVLRHDSPDGDQGYSGTVHLEVTYRVDIDGTLTIAMAGTTDAPTVLNPTNHAYWNLGGTGAPDCSVAGHQLRVDADRHVEVDYQLIPTGQLLAVDATVFDLRNESPVERLLYDPSLWGTGGIDHCLVFGAAASGGVVGLDGVSGVGGVAELSEPVSGRRMRLETDQPGLQVYTSNHGAGALPRHSTICLESQSLPDAPNQPGFPSAVLRPGETYRHRHRLTFSVD